MNISFSFEIFDSIDELPGADSRLLLAARQATQNAYAPYSRFRVGAAALLANGEMLTGSNQENASFPSVFARKEYCCRPVSARWPGVAVTAIAVSYKSESGKNEKPASPCGLCRQTVKEYEQRFDSPIRLILSGQEGPVYVLPRAGDLLPFAFEFNAAE